jgi:hypothetical protein
MLLAAFSGYLFLHLALYISVLRHLPAFAEESVVFRYHVLPAVFGVGGTIVVVLCDPLSDALAIACLVVGVQGIYSLTFLEFWSLTQGGYSIRILNAALRAAANQKAPDFSSLVQFGNDKVLLRLTNLQHLALVEQSGEMWRITHIGRLAATLAAALKSLTTSPSETA